MEHTMHKNSTNSTAAAPHAEIEGTLLQIWAEVLNTAGIGIYDDFLGLGGDSLAAMRCINQISATFGVELPLDLFLLESAHIARIASAIARAQCNSPHAPVIERISRDGDLPLSFNQEGLLFRIWWEGMERKGPSSYHLVLSLSLKGSLHLGALEAAIHEIVSRHEVLRTSFAGLKRPPSAAALSSLLKQFFPDRGDGGGRKAGIGRDEAAPNLFVQTIHPSATPTILFWNLEQTDAGQKDTAIARIVKEQWQRSFDYDSPPLLRVLLLKKSAGEHLLVFIMPHLISDRWSLQVLQKEFIVLYGQHALKTASSLPDLRLQYLDFAQWEKKQILTAGFDDLIRYWRNRLREFPPFDVADLPFAHPSPATYSRMTEHCAVTWGSEKLQAFLAQRRATPYIFTLAALHILLYYYTGKNKTATWGTIANRTHPELEHVIGWIANAHLLCIDLAGDPTIDEVLDRVLGVVVATSARQYLPTLLLWTDVLHQLNVSPRSGRGSFEERHILFDLATRTSLPASDGNLVFEAVDLPSGGVTVYGLRIMADLSNTDMTITAGYAAERFATSAVYSMLLSLRTLLEHMVTFPEKRISHMADIVLTSVNHLARSADAKSPPLTPAHS